MHLAAPVQSGIIPPGTEGGAYGKLCLNAAHVAVGIKTAKSELHRAIALFCMLACHSVKPVKSPFTPLGMLPA